MSDLNPPEGVLVLGGIAILAIPVAYLMRSAGFVMRRQFGWAVPAIAVGLIMLILPAFSVLSMAMGPGQFINAMPAARGLQLGGFDGADMMVFEEAEMGLEAPAEVS